MQYKRLPRLPFTLLLPLVLVGCGHGYAAIQVGSCPVHSDPAIVVEFEDRFSGRPLAVDASGLLRHGGRSQTLQVYEYARPDPFIYSLYADTDYAGSYRLELFVARSETAPLVEIVYEDVHVYYDDCGPITRYISVPLD